MKIIAFGDIHMATDEARQIKGVHEARGRDHILDTPICNPGMLRRGGRVAVHINQSQLEIALQ